MNLSYSLDQNDFLQHQLFIASKTERIRSQRTRSWLVYSACFLMLSFMFRQSHNLPLAHYFMVCCIIFFIGYPFYQRRHYKNYYEKYISENYKNRFGKTANLSFTDDMIESSDITGESKTKLTEIENITETGAYFYPKLKTGGNIIIPKFKINNTDELRNELKNLCQRLDIKYVEDLNWKWK